MNNEACPCRGCTKAYQRGREDAAKALEEGPGCYGVEHQASDHRNVPITHRGGWNLYCSDCASRIARGDGVPA